VLYVMSLYIIMELERHLVAKDFPCERWGELWFVVKLFLIDVAITVELFHPLESHWYLNQVEPFCHYGGLSCLIIS